MFLIGLWRSGSVCLLLFTLTLLPLLRCPFVDFFGSLASRGFPSYLSLPSEGRDAIVCFPRVFLSFRSTWGSLWSRVCFCLLGSFVDWGYGSCSLAANYSYFLCPDWLSLLISVRSMRWENRRSVFWLCSLLSLPPHLCTLGEVVRQARLPSAAPVSFSP